MALEWHENQKERWSENYARKIMLALELNIFPYIGERPIAQINPPELLEVLRRIEKRGSLDISGRTKQIRGCARAGLRQTRGGRCARPLRGGKTGTIAMKRPHPEVD